MTKSLKNKSIFKRVKRTNLFNDFEEAGEECPICKNTIVEGTGRLTNCCHNNVHIHCLEEWRETGVNGSACPLCREPNYGGAQKNKNKNKNKTSNSKISCGRRKKRRQTKKRRH
tara:strand:+ start:63 stop:404 length:342 start_codon:yes stop_codon:yes gene_type:complete